MDGFQVRKARVADRFAIAALWRELMTLHTLLDARFQMAPEGEQKYARHAQDTIRDRNGQVFVAEASDTGELVGFLLGELQTRPPKTMPGVYGFISDVYVSEAWRQRGVGSALFEEMRLWCAAHKAKAIELYVAEDNPAALAFWQSMGLKPFLRLVHLDL